MIRAIVGANWGDEGKGKITDMCADQSDIVVRYQGGANAGHTIINEHGRFALHQLPSGVFHEHITNVIANGVALNVASLKEEMQTIIDAGIKFNLLISDKAQVLMPHHVLRILMRKKDLEIRSLVQLRVVLHLSLLTSILRLVYRFGSFMTRISFLISLKLCMKR